MKEHLESGGLIVYPTSTLPGLGCLPIAIGLDNLYSTKSRPETMPVSLGVSSMSQAKSMVEIPDFLEDFLSSFIKGGITTILPALETVDSRLGGDNVAIRVFSHPAAISLAEEYGPITATSANESGIEPECNTELAAQILDIEHFVPGICPNGLGSTFVSLEKSDAEKRGWRLTVMREGVVPRADVMRWWTNPT
jgi:tRNA threonylcarbamoyl adenosine modification protein (Sua5/YciO/YrdC/YwlC family)